MLEEVGKTGAARCLVLGADVVPEIYGGDRRGIILMQQYGETILELVFLNIYWRQPVAVLGKRAHRHNKYGNEQINRNSSVSHVKLLFD